MEGGVGCVVVGTRALCIYLLVLFTYFTGTSLPYNNHFNLNLLVSVASPHPPSSACGGGGMIFNYNFRSAIRRCV
jgi:hypothetical protein